MATRERDSKGRFVKKQQSQKPMNDENDFHHEVLETYNRIADGGEEYTIEDARRQSLLEVWSLRALAIIFAFFLGWLFFGCTTKRVVEYVPIEKKVTETVVLTDTVVDVHLVPYKDSVSVKDSTSYLKNEYAYSYASLRQGILHHSLGIFPLKPTPVKLQYTTKTRRDSIPYAVPGPVEYKEIPLSPLEKFFLYTGVAATAALVIFSGIRIMKLIRP